VAGGTRMGFMAKAESGNRFFNTTLAVKEGGTTSPARGGSLLGTSATGRYGVHNKLGMEKSAKEE